jgi:uncharacterized cupredoxin-like copper-binding protein
MSDDVTTADQGSGQKANPYSTLLAVIGGGIALALVILAIGFVARGGDGGSGGGSSTAAIELTDFKIGGTLDVAAGDVTLAVSNKSSSTVHNVVITKDGEEVGKSSDIAAGESEDLTLTGLEPGSYEIYCAIAGHKEAGMTATLTVSGEGGGGSGDSAMAGMDMGGGSSSGGSENYAQMDKDMMTSFQPFVDALTSGKPNTKGIGGQELAPKVEADGTKVFELTAAITDWEVAPGQKVKAWTYNGTAPGPTIRGEVGDRIKVVLNNKLPMGTDIHMHGMVLPNTQDGVSPVTQKLVEPGETFTYEYTVEKPAVAMYHPHASGMHQVPNGMWGAMIFSPKGQGGSAGYQIPRGRTVSGTEIPADLQPSREINMVLNDAGVIGLSLNGKSFPATEAYSMKAGEWMLVNYYNEGSMSHPMHLHQFPQIVIGRDGIPLDSPYQADTVSIAPGERYTVLFKAERPGVWVWHCHILNHAERESGMFGMVTAVQVNQ